MKNIIKSLFGMLLLLLLVNSAYSWNFELGCWTNDDPILDVNILHYDEVGNFKGNFHLNEDNNAEYTLTEGDILQFDFSSTTDEDNNIRSERIFWLNENRNDMTIDFQDNINVQTNIGNDDFSSSKFDFYNYLGTGISKPQYFQENTQSISYNDGNPQNHFVKTFKPTVGDYEVLFRITDDCADSDGSDEVYKFINVKVNTQIENEYENINQSEDVSIYMSGQVCSSTFDCVKKIKNDFTTDWQVFLSSSGSSSIGDLVSDDNGDVYVSSYGNNAQKISASGDIVVQYTGATDVVSAIDLDNSNNVYVGSRDNNVRKYSNDGTLLNTFNVGNDVTDIKVNDNTNDFYVLTYDASVKMYNSNGILQWTYSNGIGYQFTTQMDIDYSTNTLFIGTSGSSGGDTSLKAISYDGNLLWSSDVYTTNVMGVSYYDGYVYGGTYDGIIKKHNKDNGQVVWELSGQGNSRNLQVYNNKLYSSGGKVYDLNGNILNSYSQTQEAMSVTKYVPSVGNICDGYETFSDTGEVDIVVKEGCYYINLTNSEVIANIYNPDNINNVINVDMIDDTGKYPSVKLYGDFNINFDVSTLSSYVTRAYFDFNDNTINSNIVGDYIEIFNAGDGNIDVTSDSSLVLTNSGYATITTDNRYVVQLKADNTNFDITSTNYQGLQVGSVVGANNNIVDFNNAIIELYNSPTNANIGQNVFNNIQGINIYSISNNRETIFGNIFKSNTDDLSWTGNLWNDNIIGKNVNGKYLGNAYLDQNGNDIYTCNTTLNDIYYNNKNYKVCSEPMIVYEYEDIMMGGTYYYKDYIIVTDEESGGIDPLNPIEENQLPRAVLNIDNNEVEIGTTICWDTTDSYDPDGTIVKKEVYVNNVKQSVSDSDCFTKNTPSIIPIRLYVEDNEGDSDIEQKSVAFTNTNATCDLNNPPTVVLSYSRDINNLYYLNMTSTDLDDDTLEYAWSVNGEVINGENIYTSIDYSQIVYGTAFDGCDMGGDYIYIDTGNNQSNPIDGINVNLICSPQGIFTPTTVSCEVVYDLKGQTLEDITWIMDNTHYNENDGSSIFSRVIGDTEEHLITVSVSSLDGQVKSDYYRFNLVVDSGGNDGGGGGSPTIEKDICDIDIEPTSVAFDDDTSLVSIVITNNDVISWSPDYKFEDVDGYNSISNDLTITNEFGTIQADQVKEIGIAYSGDIFSTEQVNAKNLMVLTSDNCADIEIEINTDITNLNKIEEFIDTPLLSNLSLDNLLETSLLSEELIGDNEFLGKIKVWQLGLLVVMLMTLILWKWKAVKSKNGNERIISNLIIKSSIILVVTIFVTYALVELIRYIVGVL